MGTTNGVQVQKYNCSTKPLARLIAPGIHASHLHDDPLGRALDTLSAYGVTALFSRLASMAAKRLGLGARSQGSNP